MRTSTWLRIASAFTLILCVGHTLGRPWTPDHGVSTASVIAGMKSVRFDVMGFSRSYWDFYQGFGLSISVLLLSLAVLLWQLAAIARVESGRVRPLIAVLLAAFIAISALDVRYFFTAPLALSVCIALSLALALRSA